MIIKRKRRRFLRDLQKGKLLIFLKKYQVYFELVLLAWIWAAAFIGVRLIATEIPALLGAGLRYLIASLFFSLFLWKGLPKMDSQKWLGIILAALMGVFSYNYAFFIGLQSVSASEAAIFMSIMPALTALVGVIFLKERLHRLGWVGIILAFMGEFLILSWDKGVAMTPGQIALLFSIVSFILYGVITKKMLYTIPPLSSVSLIVIAGTLMLGLPLSFQQNVVQKTLTISTSNWIILCFLGIFATAIGNLLYYRGIQKIGLIKTTYFINLIPVFTTIQGAWLLGEDLTINLFAGGGIIILGVFLVLYQKNPKTHKTDN